MYRLSLTVVEILDLYDVTAVLLSDEEGDGWQRIATTSDTLSLNDGDSQLDPFARILAATKQWSIRAIQG